LVISMYNTYPEIFGCQLEFDNNFYPQDLV